MDKDVVEIVLYGVVICVCVALFSVFIFWLPSQHMKQHSLRRDAFVEQLETIGYDVVEGIVESPSVIIVIRDEAEFLNKVKEVDACTVYYRYWMFYVFDSNMQLAYRYVVE